MMQYCVCRSVEVKRLGQLRRGGGHNGPIDLDRSAAVEVKKDQTARTAPPRWRSKRTYRLRQLRRGGGQKGLNDLDSSAAVEVTTEFRENQAYCRISVRKEERGKDGCMSMPCGGSWEEN